jgi:PAS domain S-box-containing protein
MRRTRGQSRKPSAGRIGTALVDLFGRTAVRNARVATLRGDRARAQRFIAEARDVFFETDMEGRLTFLNASWTGLTGQCVDASMRRFTGNFVVPDDRDVVTSIMAGFLAGSGDYVRTVLRFYHADGSERRAEVMCQPIRSSDGRVTGVSGTMHDVTARDAAIAALAASEARLAASEARYRSLVESAADALVDIDLDGVCRYVSPAVEHVAGLDPDQIVNLSFWRYTHPEDVAVQRALLASLAEGHVARGSCQYRSIDAEGRTRWIEAILHGKRAQAGNVTGFIGAIRDVTEIVSVVAELELLHDVFDTPLPTLH